MWVRQWAGLEVAKRRGGAEAEVRSAGGGTKEQKNIKLRHRHLPSEKKKFVFNVSKGRNPEDIFVLPHAFLLSSSNSRIVKPLKKNWK